MKSWWLICVGLIIFLSFAFSVQAQGKVIKGEYIVIKKAGDFSSNGLGNFDLIRRRDPEFGIMSEEVVDFNPNDTTCNDILESGEVTFCEPNYYVEAFVSSNDEYGDKLYGMTSIYANIAWGVSTGTKDVVVAVLDTGIDYNHPDLAENIWINPGEIPNNGIDDDANGWIDDIHGINSSLQNGDPMDDNGHGTHVSGTIGAKGNNSIGVAGVNWNVSIMGLKFLNANGGGSIYAAIRAIDYMIDMKNKYGLNLKVSNNSWGGAGFAKSLEDAIRRANDAGIVFVAAAGNSGQNNDISPSYPANYDLPNVVTVAATDSKNAITYFSNYGQSVDIAAPGMSILSTLPNGRYGSLSGTSMATPHVSGALALFSSVNPLASHIEMINVMNSHGTYSSGLSGKVKTSARLNVAGMFGLAPVSTPPPSRNVKSRVKKIVVRNSNGSRDLRSGDGLRISVATNHSLKRVPMILSINRIQCKNSKTINLKVGVNKFRGRLGLLSNSVKNLRLKVSNKIVENPVRSFRRSSKTRSFDRLSQRNLNTNCNRILKSISSRKA